MKSPQATINIDVGGTFTDCFLALGGQVTAVKVPTTQYDLSQGFIKVVDLAAQRLGISLQQLLQQVAAIRYSTTVALNKLLQRQGPRLGLLTTEGFEHFIYIGKGAQWSDGLTDREKRNLSQMIKPEPLIPRDLSLGIRERVDSNGRVVRPLDEDDVREKLHTLVDRGVRGIVVCLLWSFANPAHEKRIEQIVMEEYPDAYLGNIPVILSSDVLPKQHEYPRGMTAILNAYLHQALKEELAGIGDRLRDLGFSRPLMLIHNSGGMAEVFRSPAVQTFNAGPVAGLLGCQFWARKYGFQNAIGADMGGTSFDIGLIVDGGTKAYKKEPVIDRWMVGTTMLETQSIGAGGGSIARINRELGGKIEVGPHSAGAMPGPACYDQGGEEPTVTDADVVLGHIDPGAFYGGKIRLNRRRAVRAIEEKIARPLGVTVEQAAWMIKRVVDAHMGNTILKETIQRGYDPRQFILFALGGAGPTHCCGFGFYAQVPRIVTLPYSPVFCAMGSATMDVLHIYEKTKNYPLLFPANGGFNPDFTPFNDTVEELKGLAVRDLSREGVSAGEILYSLDLDMKFAHQIHVKRATSPCLSLGSLADAQRVLDQFIKEYTEEYSHFSVNPSAGVTVENFVLKACIPQAELEIPAFDLEGEDPGGARKGVRPVFWGNGYEETPVFAWEKLRPGNQVRGPAVIEADDTTYVIPPQRTFTVDQFRNGIIV